MEKHQRAGLQNLSLGYREFGWSATWRVQSTTQRDVSDVPTVDKKYSVLCDTGVNNFDAGVKIC